MARPQYPLQALRQLRDERADAQAARLARQIARAEAAQAKVAEAERARREHDLRARATLAAERQRLASGRAAGADWLRLTEFEVALRAQAALFERAELALRETLQMERDAERRERAELSRLAAEATLVQAHEAEFHEQHAALTLKAEEEAALEQWNARRP